jgi:hypothetical protein
VRRVNQIIDLGDGRLHALIHPLALDGKMTSHPVTSRGCTTTNCYVLLEEDRALLWGTGFSTHQAALLDGLAHLVADRPLGLVIPRLEFASMCNARPIADRFTVDVVHQQMRLEPHRFLNFRPTVAGSPDGLEGVRRTGLSPHDPLPVDRQGRRLLELVDTPLRLLPMHWGYDAATRTLFTNDMFAWGTASRSDGPWVSDGEPVGGGDRDVIRDFLVHGRYWWLPGADTDPIRRALDRLLADHQVEVIAPDHGVILRGAAVGAAVAALDDVLAELAGARPLGVEAGAWTFAGAR